MKTPGELFRAHRKQRALSQAECATHLGVSKAFVSYVETNQREAGYAFWSKAASLFHVPIENFYELKFATEEWSADTHDWLELGETLDKMEVTPEQVREWVSVIQAYEKKSPL